MSFFVSPFHPAAQRLFQHAPEKLQLPRKPIAERARLQADQRSISFSQALIGSTANSYSLWTNTFWLHRRLKSDNFSIEAHLVSHFGSLRPQTQVGLWLKEERENKYKAEIILANDPLDQETANNALLFCRSSFLLLDLDIDQRSELIYLRTLKAERRGVAGNALAALYGFARSISIRHITYSVSPGDNVNAKQFYFHMDFGRPNNIAWDSAVVTVR
ncbi:MAG: hypothetical protein JW782_07575 [Candidatus Saganbacteria bacterium]|nr:hypothetical protein [Candidatus Saganbacteria bacterium]